MPNNTITASGIGTWTAPANLNSLTIEAWGAGGGGGGSNTNSTAGGSGGGGGGAYARITVTGLAVGNTFSYNVGGGGIGGPAGNNNGSPGYATTFNNNTGGNTSTIVGANAGAGGINSQNSGNKAGLGGAANVSITDSWKGGNGANNGGTRLGSGGGAGAGNANAGADVTGQTGAVGDNGGGTGGNGGARNANGNNYQTAPGAGGGGAGQSNGTARAGGYGSNGQLILTWDINASSNNRHSYTNGSAAPVPASDNHPAYTQGKSSIIDNKSSYIKGSINVVYNKASYTKGKDNYLSSKIAYTEGKISFSGFKSAFTEGYVAGGPVNSSKIAFAMGLGSNNLSPDGDISVSGIWWNELNSPNNLYQSIDETTPNDNDYIWDTNPTTGHYYECSLNSPVGVPGSGQITIFYRGKDSSNSGKSRANVQLRQGGTVISSGTQILTSTPQTYYFQLSEAERANITDWNDLRIRILPQIS